MDTSSSRVSCFPPTPPPPRYSGSPKVPCGSTGGQAKGPDLWGLLQLSTGEDIYIESCPGWIPTARCFHRLTKPLEVLFTCQRPNTPPPPRAYAVLGGSDSQNHLLGRTLVGLMVLAGREISHGCGPIERAWKGLPLDALPWAGLTSCPTCVASRNPPK